jgi:hypothetical protein
MTTTPRDVEDDAALHLSNFQLDRLAAGTLDDPTVARVQAHLAVCGACQARRQALDDDRARFVPDPALRALLAAAPAPASNVIPFRARMRGLAMAAPALAAAAALVVAVTRDSGDETSTKGGARYEFFVADDTGLRPAPRGATVQANDVIQVARSGEDAAFVGLFSVDGAGVFTRFVPADGAVLAAIAAGERVTLPQSVRLDATPGTEEFVVVECTAPVDVAMAEAAARGGSVPSGCVSTRHPLEKRP